MRKPILAANWKMNKTPAEAVEFVKALHTQVMAYPSVETVVCPPFVALPAVVEALRDAPVGVGAQNLHWKASGAYTGEVSAPMLAGWVEYVIIGHSERRQFFAETDKMVNQKAKLALQHGLKPIVCVGENLEHNKAGLTDPRVTWQVRAALADLTAEQVQDVVIAYEPIWAVGTGRTATPEWANRVCGSVARAAIEELYGQEVAQAIRIQYGGSANEKNIGDLMAMPDIDGVLVGIAGLTLDSFVEMVRVTASLY